MGKKQKVDYDYHAPDLNPVITKKAKLRELHVTALNEAQKIALKAIHDNKITFIYGSPGTGKTHLPVTYGLKQLMLGKFDRIIFTRPCVEAFGEKMGFLPGTYSDKIAPFMIPIFDIIKDFLPALELSRYINEGQITTLPLAFMRGCAQPLSSKILTPQGFVTMGDIKVGDVITGSDGNTQKVCGVYPQGEKDIYKITFSDGSFTECCEEHLWLTQTLYEKRHNKCYSVKNTKAVIETLNSSKNRQKNHEIPVVKPINFQEKKMLIDPYVMGLLLGDGCLGKLTSIGYSTADTELVNYVEDRIKKDNMVVHKHKTSDIDYIIVYNTSNGVGNPYKKELNRLSLLGTESHTKFIPEEYKMNSIENRIEILRGLLDSDGFVDTQRSGKSRIGFSSTSEQLAKDVVFIVQSLGGICHQRTREPSKIISVLANGHRIISKHKSYVLDIVLRDFNPFRLRRKADLAENRCRVKRLVEKIEYIGKKEAKCISVSNADELYITDDFILTHNTFKRSFILLDEAQNSQVEQMHLFLTRFGEGSKVVVTGDLNQTDLDKKVKNGLMDAITRLDGVEDVGLVFMDKKYIVRDPLVGTIDELYKSQ